MSGFIIKEEVQEFIAKYLGDMTKAIFTVGFAGYFFKDLPLLVRIGFILLAFAFLGASVIILQHKGGRQ